MPADHASGALALSRFGLGGRADGDLQAASADPRGMLMAELRAPGIADLGGADLLPTSEGLKRYFSDQEAKRLAREATEKARDATLTASAGGGPRIALPAEGASVPMAATPTTPNMPTTPAPPPPEQSAYRTEAFARLRRAAQARVGFVERLVAFWSNHFCISVTKGGFVRAIAGSFEREAIRPHVLGRFADMLLAVERHPAMVVFLDNQQSMGANSSAGRKPGRGLNENLGREILELHTLGVSGGYEQADVTALSNIITGWTFAGRDSKIADPGTALFLRDYHEPGPQILLARTYPQDGREQGEAALRALAQHPATAAHIAQKLARHFVSDDPPAALVDRLRTNFLRTDGDLLALATTLIESPEAWTVADRKLRDPWQFLTAAIRLTGREPNDAGAALGALSQLGQPLWGPPGPNGFSDATSAWVTPEGMKTRLDIADRIAARVPDGPNPSDLLAALAGDAATRETRETLARAASRRQGLALLLMSPEIQRR